MSWIYLIIAGVFEIGWPLGFKLADSLNTKFFGYTLAIGSMALSGYFLYIAQKSIPMGTAYAVWTGIGTVGTLLIGIIFFNDSSMIPSSSASKILYIFSHSHNTSLSFHAQVYRLLLLCLFLHLHC